MLSKNNESLSFNFLNKCLMIYLNTLSLNISDEKMYSNTIDGIKIIISKTTVYMGNNYIDIRFNKTNLSYISVDYNEKSYNINLSDKKILEFDWNIYSKVFYIDEIINLGHLSDDECFYFDLKYSHIF